MRNILLASLVFFWSGVMAQKNLVPASRIALLDIELPSGSKQDKRLLSVSSAKWMLDTEAAKVNYELEQTEVYQLPPADTSVFSAAKLSSMLRKAGWIEGVAQDDRKYTLLEQGGKLRIMYLDITKKSTSLYVASCKRKASTPQVSGTVNAASATPATEPGHTSPGGQPVGASSSSVVNTSAERSAVAGTWLSSVSSAWSANDPAGSMTAGYTKHQYTFHPDGTYTFYTKQFRSVGYDIILVREAGAYILRDNRIEIIPSSSVVEVWSKKDGVDKYGVLKSKQARPLEKVEYTFTRHYFQGLQEWSLVLQAEQPTKREGQFSSNDTFRNAYYYRPISNTNTPVDLPD